MTRAGLDRKPFASPRTALPRGEGPQAGRLAAPVAALALVTFAPAAAPADDGDVADPDARAKVVRVRSALAGSSVRFRASYVVTHDGRGMSEADLDLPPRGVITAATVRIGKQTHALALGGAEEVEQRLMDAFEAPRADAFASAVSIRDEARAGAMISTLLPRKATVVVELEIEAPTCYARDRRHVEIPASWRDALDADGGRIVHRDRDDDDRAADGEATSEAARIDARCSDDGSWGDDKPVWLALPTRELASKPAGDQRIGTVAGRFAHGADQLARVELALAKTMTAIPDDLATAFVVDGSRSLYAGVLDAQAGVIASYLALAPRSQVQVVAFDRAAHPILSKWTKASSAAGKVARALAKLRPKNGSDLDTGLAEAGRWLASHEGTRRIVVFTDELFPARLAALDPASLAARLPPDTVVHVVAIEHGDGTIVRNDDLALAQLASTTGGVPVTASAGTGVKVDALRLVRPISLDHVRVIAPGFSAIGSAAVAGVECVNPFDATEPIDLAEGTACTWWATGPSTTSSIAIEGLLWGKRWRRVVDLGTRQSVTVAREAWDLVDRAELSALAEAIENGAQAVNPKWSLFASWGGTGGYPEDLGGMGSSGFGCGCGGGSHDIGVGHIGTGYTIKGPTVEDQVRDAIAACHTAGDGAVVGLELETTRQEIVGVTITAITGIAGEPATKMRTCIEDAVWDLALWVGRPADHARWPLSY